MINGHSTGCWMFEKIGGFFCQMSKTLKPLPEIGTPHIYLCNEKSRARYGNESNYKYVWLVDTIHRLNGFPLRTSTADG